MDSTTRHNKVRGAKQSGNIVSFRTDAAFFYERGVRYLERNDLKRALKAFRRTVEVEPQNPVNHCNLAGVLSELGDFEASNEVLLRVLTEIDPSMHECQFYLANNYANMGEYRTAEEYVLRYLDSDPEGEYVEDAEEMLDVLVEDFGGGDAYKSWQQKRREQERMAARKDGRHLLEDGQFEAAVEWLEAVVARDSTNLAAHNNLSLAYYYTGQQDLALETAYKVLELQPFNIHAMCNLTVFLAQHGPKDELQRMVQSLLKVFPLHYDQAMKVGTTLGLVGEHRGAYNLFLRLASVVEGPEPALIHSVAAAAANLGLYATAKRWWRALANRAELTDVASYYIDQVDDAARRGKSTVRVSYQYDYPLHVQFAKMKHRLNEGDLTVWQNDPLLRASLYWGLRHGSTDTRRAVLRTLGVIADDDAQKALRLFLKRPGIEPGLQAAALYALQRAGCRGRIEVCRDGEMQSMRMSDVPKDIVLAVDPAFSAVWMEVETALRGLHKARFIPEAKRYWISFLHKAFLRADVRIVKPKVWAAAILYVVLRDRSEAVRQKDIGDWFGVSVSAVSKTVSRLVGLQRADVQ